MKFIFLSLLTLVLLCSVSPAFAQSAGTQFQPGEWQVDSVVTSMGRTLHRNVNVCAKNATDTWQAGNAKEQCTPPTVTTMADGYNIQIDCSGGSGPVQWKSASNIHETFSGGGSAFIATGATATTVSYSGHAPIHASATIHATGKRTGACK